jgi:hypothetical protein
MRRSSCVSCQASCVAYYSLCDQVADCYTILCFPSCLASLQPCDTKHITMDAPADDRLAGAISSGIASLPPYLAPATIMALRRTAIRIIHRGSIPRTITHFSTISLPISRKRTRRRERRLQVPVWLMARDRMNQEVIWIPTRIPRPTYRQRINHVRATTAKDPSLHRQQLECFICLFHARQVAPMAIQTIMEAQRRPLATGGQDRTDPIRWIRAEEASMTRQRTSLRESGAKRSMSVNGKTASSK